MAFFTIVVSLLIPVATTVLFFFLARQTGPLPLLLRTAIATLAPILLALITILALWLPTYSGVCGGFGDSVTPCSFSQYVLNTLFVAFMSLFAPSLLAVLISGVLSWRQYRKEEGGR